MANDILNSELFQTQTTEKKTISTKPTTETKKEGSSLFDSLLKDAKADEGNSHQLSKDVTAKKIIEKTATSSTTSHHTTTKKESFDTVSSQVNREVIQKNDKGEVSKKNFPSQSTQINESIKNTVSTSTAHVTETMKTSGTKIVETTTQKSTEDKTDSKILKKDSPLADKTNSDSILKKGELKEEQKKPLSLLDKMMQDAKKDIQTEDKSLTKTVAPQQEEGTLQQLLKENKGEKKETTSVERNLQVVEKEGKTAQTNLIPTKKEEVVKEVKPNISPKIEEKKDVKSEKENHSAKLETTISKVSKPTSLLDKIVQEITDKNSEEGEEKTEIQKTTPKTALKIDGNLGKLFVELSEGIQLESTQQESNFENKETKETKILSSLADSLSGKTKIQKKVDETTQLESLQDSKGQFGANIFLSNQKVQGELLSKQKLTEAKEVLKDGEKTTKTVKKSADILELKASSIEVVSEGETPTITSKQTTTKSNDLGLHTQQTFLNRMFLNKEANEQILNNKVMEEKVAEIKTLNEDNKKTNSDVTITIEKTLVETFTTKVIASKQAMGSFMSDVARNMYLNYKPPVTAFKINLDPINLGSIAIVMRSNKGENSLSVSLNMSQNATYETMNENKATLQNALGKVFNQNEENISLDFGMQSDSSHQEFEQQKQNEHNQQTIQNRNSSETTIEKDKQTIDLDTTKSYM
jgi:hypothetical protein